MAKSKSFTLQGVKEAAENYLLLDDPNLVEIPLACFMANKLPTDPLWMFITGPPSNAKTEILRAMNGHDQTVFVSSLTPSTLISGKETKGPDPSLIFQLDSKLLIIKDFTTILTLRDESKAEILSQLREVYDGHYSKAFGTGKFKEWKGKIGLLAAVTPIIDRYMSVTQLLGERFLHYRTASVDQYSVAKRAMSNVFRARQLREEFHDAMSGYMSVLGATVQWELNPNELIEDMLATLAVFCATARTGVVRNRYDRTLEVMPMPEGAARLAQQFNMLGQGLAIVRNQKGLDKSIYEIIKKVARDTLPALRLRLLDALWRLYLEKEEWYTTSDVALEAKMPTSTAKLELENLHLIGLLERDRDGTHETAAYTWAPSNDLVSMQSISGVLSLIHKSREEGKKEEN